MGNSNQFSIGFSGLKAGLHQFDYEIENTFFDNFENSEVKFGSLTVHLELEKKEKMMTFLFAINGNVVLECDRCLENYEQQINTNPRLIIKLGKERSEETDELEIIPESANEINIAQYIYEYICLALPIRKVHPENEKGEPLCNKTILEKLKEHTTNKHTTEELDPRWDALKDLKFN